MLATQDPRPHCGCQCGKQAVVRCLDCLPFPFLCEDCDTLVHSRFVLHNRESLTGGFRQPLSELRQQMARYNLVLPALSCTSCCLTWSPTIKDIQP
ncbi:hypothetical protein PO909_013602 [Leuciscus waleckii]